MSITFSFNGKQITMKNSDSFADLLDNHGKGNFLDSQWTLNGQSITPAKQTKLTQFLQNGSQVGCQTSKIRFITEAPPQNNFQNQGPNNPNFKIQANQPINTFPNQTVQPNQFQQSGGFNIVQQPTPPFLNQPTNQQNFQQQAQYDPFKTDANQSQQFQNLQFPQRSFTSVPFTQPQLPVQATKSSDPTDVFATENLNQQYYSNLAQSAQPQTQQQTQPQQQNPTEEDVFATSTLLKYNEAEYEPKRLAYLQSGQRGDKSAIKNDSGFTFVIEDYGKTVQIASVTGSIQLTITDQFSVGHVDQKSVQEKLAKSLNFHIVSLNYTRIFYLQKEELLVIQWQTGKIITLEFRMSSSQSN